MKLKILATAAIVTSVWLTTPVKAENPDHVKRLLETKQCQGCDLSGANLTNANLEGANLSGANLRDAVLVGANLTNANLQKADLTCANLTHTKLINVNLDKTNLIGATGIEQYESPGAISLVACGQPAGSGTVDLKPSLITTASSNIDANNTILYPYPRGLNPSNGIGTVDLKPSVNMTDGAISTTGIGTATLGTRAVPAETLTALIPPETTNEFTLTVVTEYPTFFAYVPPLNVPQTDLQTAEFVLQDEKGNEIYRRILIRPWQGGIVNIRLPATGTLAPLEIDKVYRWQFKLFANSNDPSKKSLVEGVVKRIKPSPTLLREIKKAAPNERPAIYAKAGLWYEALTTLAQLRRANPFDATLTQQWEDLLKSVGLDRIAEKTLLESVPQSNESRVQPPGTGEKPNPPAAGAKVPDARPSRGYMPPDTQPPSASSPSTGPR